jgi:hypothetical protein
MRNNLFFLPLLVIGFLSCSTADKKTEQTDEVKTDTLRHDIYKNIQLIAEALPMKTKEASDFFDDLDSIVAKTPRYSQSQQFQYKTFTIFYELPAKGIVKNIGIDLDTASHVNMKQLEKQLGTKWHSADLIEVEAGKVHYSADYIDAKKVKKQIHITIGLSHQPNEQNNEVTFMNIETDENKNADSNPGK